MLLVGDRVVLRADGPPAAEYALFDLADIELRASEPGRVREHGYQTTAARARKRLDQLGATALLARTCAAVMQPVVAAAYARGPAARIVARYLGPVELFQSDAFDGATQSYRGAFIDLGLLARDLLLPGAGVAFQALFLATLLENETDDTMVLLSTDAWTKPRKPGQRTYKRPDFTDVHRLRDALVELAEQNPRPQVSDPLARADVIAFVRSRADAAPDEGSRALYASLERTIAVREIPDRGPLAEPRLWAIETRLDAGQFEHVLEELEELEFASGRTPGSTYLRARVSLALHLEPAKLIAERVSALALSMTSFQELSLLAAEAWLEAGDPRRAIPYARDLVDAPSVDEGLLVRANRILARAVGAAPNAHPTYVDSFPAPIPAHEPPATLAYPPVTAPDVHTAHAWPPAKSRVPTERGGSERSPSLDSRPPPNRTRHATRPPSPSVPPQALLPPLPPPAPTTQSHAPPLPSSYASMPAAREPSALPSALPGGSTSFTLDLPGPMLPAPAPESQAGSWRPRRGAGVVAVETRAPPSYDPRAEPDSSQLRAAPPPRVPEGELHARPTPMRPMKLPVEAHAAQHVARGVDAHAETPPIVVMAGASSPPFRLEDPPPLLPGAPLMPRLGGSADDLAEHLPLPPGLDVSPHSLDALPKSVLDARIMFTLLARELGLEYRVRRGIELRADVSGIEAMQSVLLSSFPDHTIRTSEDARELRRHGALLSEILARRFDAEWIDIAPSELGYWAMLVPPDTRVWPFGRVARLIKMGHKERDLVSFFFEIQSRARKR